MIGTELGGISFQRWQGDFKALLVEIIFERRNVLQILLITQEIDARRGIVVVLLWDGLLQGSEFILDKRFEFFEGGLEQLDALLRSNVIVEIFDELCLAVLFDLQAGWHPDAAPQWVSLVEVA